MRKVGLVAALVAGFLCQMAARDVQRAQERPKSYSSEVYREILRIVLPILSPEEAGERSRAAKFDVQVRITPSFDPEMGFSLTVEPDGVVFSSVTRLLGNLYSDQFPRMYSRYGEIPVPTLASLVRRERYEISSRECRPLEQAGAEFAKLQMPLVLPAVIGVDGARYEMVKTGHIPMQLEFSSADDSPVLRWVVSTQKILQSCLPRR